MVLFFFVGFATDPKTTIQMSRLPFFLKKKYLKHSFTVSSSKRHKRLHFATKSALLQQFATVSCPFCPKVIGLAPCSGHRLCRFAVSIQLGRRRKSKGGCEAAFNLPLDSKSGQEMSPFSVMLRSPAKKTNNEKHEKVQKKKPNCTACHLSGSFPWY